MFHQCPVAGCKKRVRNEYLMCAPHWRQVPAEVQAAVWEGYRRGQRAGQFDEQYLTARAAAVDAVNAKEAG